MSDKIVACEVANNAKIYSRDGKTETRVSFARARGRGKTTRDAAKIAIAKASHSAINKLQEKIPYSESTVKVEIKTTTVVEGALQTPTP
jgi:hypothetical protein